MLVYLEVNADNTSMIKRRIEENILENLKHFPAIGLVGPRQSGKTTLAKTIAQKFNKSVVYLDLENPTDFGKLENAQLYLEQF